MALDRNRLLKPARNLRKLVGRMKRNPPPEDVHDLRTNTRRFEAMFEALSLDGRGIDKAILKDLGRLRKRAGRVRDMDVLTAFASKLHPQGEEDCSVQLLEYLGAKRKKQAARLSAEASELRRPLRKELKRTKAVLTSLLRETGDADSGKDAAADATANAAKLAARLGTPQRLTRVNLHPYRLRIKELQNVLRMASSPHPIIDDLGEVKDAIGEWHDYEELVSIAQKVLEHGPGCELVSALKRTARQKYDHALSLAQRLRSEYLGRARPASRKRASAGSAKIPRPQVWEAASLLAS
jgi:CHAD domain-containing protein